MQGCSWWIALLGGLASWSLLFPLRGYLNRRMVVDIPNARSSHVRPTPRGGGLAIVAATLTGCLLQGLYGGTAAWNILAIYLLGSSAIAAISWLDDVWTLPAWLRFAVHGFGAALVIAGCGAFNVVQIPLLGPISLGWLGPVLTFIWIVGLTNAYNFMDGVDGIAGGQAVVAGIGWALLGSWLGQPLTAALGLLLAATSLGFLGHNWSPARIFMGDVGSTFLGYSFAVLPLVAGYLCPDPSQRNLLAVAAVLLLWPFIFDSGTTFFRRLLRGENVLAAHRSHLYQRLVRTNYSHRGVSTLYIAFAAIGAILATRWSQSELDSELAVAGIIPLLCGGLWLYVPYHEQRIAIQTGSVLAAESALPEILSLSAGQKTLSPANTPTADQDLPKAA